MELIRAADVERAQSVRVRKAREGKEERKRRQQV